MADRYELLRGDTLLGWIEHTNDDFPHHIGYFRAAEGYETAKHLFARERDVLAKGDLEGWQEVRSEIEAPGLTLRPAGRVGEAVTNPLVHIEGTRAWWR